MNATWTLFHLLSALRRGTPPAQAWREFQRLGLPLRPRLAFWLGLARQAGFLTHLTHSNAFFEQWLAWPADAQALHLLEAWQNTPTSGPERALRQRLLARLRRGQALRTSDERLLSGLEALSITHQGQLSAYGRCALGLQGFPSPLAPAPWQAEGDTLRIAHPTHWKLLWQLEQFLSPSAPLTYLMDEKNLRSMRGDPESLIACLEQGLPLKTGLPAAWRARILGQPSLSVVAGRVLEFSSPAELRQLRASPVLREYFERILSPRHALINEENLARFERLCLRRGIALAGAGQAPNGLSPGPRATRSHLTRGELLRPLGPSQRLEDFIQQSIRQQMAFEMLYHAPGGQEMHRITPLLVETRGGQTYVIAYSHTRRGQRTYRLDRMEVPGTLPGGALVHDEDPVAGDVVAHQYKLWRSSGTLPYLFFESGRVCPMPMALWWPTPA